MFLLAASGCGLPDFFDFDHELPGSREDLDDCIGEATTLQKYDNLEIKDEYDSSLHELVACGGLSAQLCFDAAYALLQSVGDAGHDATPPGWFYLPGGTYRTKSPSMQMDARFVLARDFSFGHRGELVDANIFVGSNYAEGFSTELSGDDLLIHFDAPGPLVELLGQGPNPASPIVLNLDDGSLEAALLDALDFEADIVWADDQSHSIVYYHLESPPIRARHLVEGSDELDFVLHEANAERDDLMQQLSIDRWTLAYSEDGRGLTGEIEFRVDGGYFDYAGRFTFDDSRFPDEEVFCQ